ncbi:MAG: hypothetical protein ACREP2_01505, partial [Rhodanobacteraceae bacterium]
PFQQAPPFRPRRSLPMLVIPDAWLHRAIRNPALVAACQTRGFRVPPANSAGGPGMTNYLVVIPHARLHRAIRNPSLCCSLPSPWAPDSARKQRGRPRNDQVMEMERSPAQVVCQSLSVDYRFSVNHPVLSSMGILKVEVIPVRWAMDHIICADYQCAVLDIASREIDGTGWIVFVTPYEADSYGVICNVARVFEDEADLGWLHHDDVAVPVH